ncbi:hypothetical protein [Deinococcus altitudinis]|uniref:hypothetical protein n=1 Tax=Deinococcus altitudinis TaxID=468914 RepID=UPI003891389C
MTAFTDRTLPAPWEECDVCGKAAGLPSTTGAHLTVCGPCAAQQAIVNAAEESLKALAAPVLGAWAAQWTAAGVPLDELDAITEHLSGAGMCGDYAQAYRLKALRFLRREYAAPVFEKSAPERVTLNPEDLPTLTGYTLADPARGVLRPYFLDSEGTPHTFPLACDALTVALPGGDALLIFTGLHGATDLHPVPGLARAFRVVAALLPQVCSALNPATQQSEDLMSFIP